MPAEGLPGSYQRVTTTSTLHSREPRLVAGCLGQSSDCLGQDQLGRGHLDWVGQGLPHPMWVFARHVGMIAWGKISWGLSPGTINLRRLPSQIIDLVESLKGKHSNNVGGVDLFSVIVTCWSQRKLQMLHRGDERQTPSASQMFITEAAQSDGVVGTSRRPRRSRNCEAPSGSLVYLRCTADSGRTDLR